jgi:glycosyltransferase involved in cell wall biosynthesis
MPLFSIVIPTYNRAVLLDNTIKSVLNQQFINFELLIIDDGSTDNTEEVVKMYLNDFRVTYFKKHNAERGAARNFGARKAKGEYVNFFDSDDLMYNNHLEVAKQFIELNQSPEIFHLAYDYKTVAGELIYTRNSFSENSSQMLLFDNILSCNGVFIRKDVALLVPFEENRIMASAEDWALWIKLLAYYNIQYCNEVTSAIISHDARSIHTINIDKLVERDMFLINHLKTDKEVVQIYRGTFEKFKAERYTFIMLACSQQKRRKEVFEWAAKALRVYPGILFSKRFLASIKNSLK